MITSEHVVDDEADLVELVRYNLEQNGYSVVGVGSGEEALAELDRRRPDLVVLAHHGYDLKAKVKSNQVFGRSNLVGMHTQDDAFFANTAGVGCESIFEAGGIILTSLR